MEETTKKLEALDIGYEEKETKIDFKKFHFEKRIDPNKKYFKPPLAISIGVDPVAHKGTNYPLKLASYGNISVITGEEKSRKSFLKSMIIACAIGGNADDFNEDIRGHGLRDKWIIDIDSEQGDYDAHLNYKRIPEMVGAVPNNYHYIPLRELNNKERFQYLQWLFMESDFRNHLGLVAIDGYVDFCKNFNDLEECQNLNSELLKYSSITKSHITGVLHLNPNSDKARGHLGTILQQKAETVINIKDIGECSEVSCKRIRGSKKFETFYLGVDQNWLPYKMEYKDTRPVGI